MLYVFFGKDSVNVRKHAHTFAEAHVEKGVRIERIDNAGFEPGSVRDAVGSISLFGEQTLHIFDMPSLDAAFEEELKQFLETMAASERMYVVIEGPLLAAEKKRYAKWATKMEEYTASAEDRYNTFSLSDALLRKNKKELWMGLSDARMHGISPEEIIGILWWQLKTLRLVSVTHTAAEAGMKEYAYSKTKRALPSFKEGEVENLSQSLLAVYHEGHAGKKDIDLALEKWTLSI